VTAKTIERILVCVDFSEVTDAVVDHAKAIAALAGAEARLLHVAAPNPDFVGFEAGPDAVRKQVAQTLRDEHKALEILAQRLSEANVRATSLMVQGPTAATILEQIRRFRADLVVLGSHGHGALYHLLAGSVAEELLRKSSVPVLVVPSNRRQPPS
jgi:nucleotide-binding universal stress UspA family protein